MIKTVPHSSVSPQMISNVMAMYEKYKRLVYRSPCLLARFCKANLICFPGLIYCDQEPLWLLKVIEDDCYFLGVHIRLTTRCNIWTVCKLIFL